MSTKNDLLTTEDLQGSLNKRLISLIEFYSIKNNLSKDSIKILDWGSGRGKTVAMLRQQGYQAYGVEIDPRPYYKGLAYFQNNYENPNDFLKLVSENCLTPFADQYFDIIFSWQVLEHIVDLEIVCREMSRITKKGGLHLHQFPAKWHLIEQHLYMPCIHWLPKDWMRFSLIYFYTLLGIEPYWDELCKADKFNKARKYYEYSIQRTFYRSISQIRRIFEHESFYFQFETQRSRLKLLPFSLNVYLEKI